YQRLSYLQRLLYPIRDALDWANAGRSGLNVLSVLTEEMYHQDTAFWAWTPQDWVKLLGPNEADFTQRYHKPRETRQYLVAVAYLLCGFRDLHVIGRINQKALASKIFGNTHVENAVQLVCNEAQRW